MAFDLNYSVQRCMATVFYSMQRSTRSKYRVKSHTYGGNILPSSWHVVVGDVVTPLSLDCECIISIYSIFYCYCAYTLSLIHI